MFDSQDIAGVVTELEVLEKRFADLMEQARQGTWRPNGALLQELVKREDNKAMERVLEELTDLCEVL